MRRARLALLAVLLAACSKGPEAPAPQPPKAEAPEPPKAEPPKGAPSPEELERQRAQSQPYPNDAGPAEADVSGYSAAHQEGYRLLRDKCQKCHTASRPLNSQFVELDAAEQAAARKASPDIFGDPLIWQVEEGIWRRYVKRMMAKPGCGIASEEGKKIYEFLSEHSKREKVRGAAAWRAHRGRLLAEFKTKHPERAKELFGKQLK